MAFDHFSYVAEDDGLANEEVTFMHRRPNGAGGGVTTRGGHERRKSTVAIHCREPSLRRVFDAFSRGRTGIATSASEERGGEKERKGQTKP